MVAAASLDPTSVKIYTVNGPTAGSSSSLPSWLTIKKRSQKSKKRVHRETVESQIELIQGFEFPEACNKIKVTRDGKSAIGIGTYKPQMRVWDLEELTLKFERHTDAEGVDFVMLSDDWTKSIHLQNDRSLELHTQGGFHYRTRIPRFGRALAYHFPSCDAYVGATGNEVFRLNLSEGRFMKPIELSDDDANGDDINGVNCVDINPAHQLLAFGVDGTSGSVHFYDPRSRSSVGILRLPYSQLVPPPISSTLLPDSVPNLSVTALASRSDGLTYAVGTSTGHTLLYDVRTNKHFGLKDQGYGLPIRSLEWITAGSGTAASRMAGDGLVMSADKKVVKIWDRDDPSTNFLSLTPSSDTNHVTHVPGTGILLSANEATQLSTYFVPQLGPAPKWAPFLENVTEEMADTQTGGAGRGAWEDFKFLEKKELVSLGLDNLIGTPTLKPYMHGYFISLKLYETARLIANPFAYEEYREKKIKEKMDKLAETRIRSGKNPKVKLATAGADGEAAKVTVNQALAKKVLKEEERERKREERRQLKKAKAAVQQEEDEEDDDQEAGSQSENEDEMDVDEGEGAEVEEKKSANLLNDSRFSALFTNPDFEVDETTREFALLNPSTVAKRANEGPSSKRSQNEDSGDSGADDDSEDGSDDGDDSAEDDSDSDNEALTQFDLRTRPGQKNERMQEVYDRTKAKNRSQGKTPRLVPLKASGSATGAQDLKEGGSFGQRKASLGSSARQNGKTKGKARSRDDGMDEDMDGAMEFTWTPSASAAGEEASAKSSKRRGKQSEMFGAGMQKMDEAEWEEEMSKAAGDSGGGRTQRRKGIRSGSRNAFRKI